MDQVRADEDQKKKEDFDKKKNEEIEKVAEEGKQKIQVRQNEVFLSLFIRSLINQAQKLWKSSAFLLQD